MAKVPLVTFNNGLKYPQLGLGTFGLYLEKAGEVREAVYHAITCGYRHFDCALVYKTEKEVGEAVERAIQEKLCKREDLFITTKLWNTFHREDLVVPALKQSLENLNLTYLDLYLIHWPHGFKEGDDLFPVDENKKTLYSDSSYLDTWKAMEKCLELGLTKSIGVCNFNSKQMNKLLQIAKIKPVTNQVEFHPYLHQKKLKDYLDSVDISLTGFCPLGSAARPWIKNKKFLLEDPRVVEIANKHNKTPAQIVLRWQIEKGNLVIPKSLTKSRIESNIQIFDFSLNPEDMDVLDNMHCNYRISLLAEISDHPDYPFKEEF